MTDETYALVDVTCTTGGCENAGHIIAVLALAVNPVVVCGPCGAFLTPTPSQAE